MALNYLKLCCRHQHTGHLKKMRYFPLTLLHHNDMLCRTDMSPQEAIIMENRDTVVLQQRRNLQKPFQAKGFQDFGKDTLLLLPETTEDKLKLHFKNDTINDIWYSTVAKKKNHGRKMTKNKVRCVSEPHMALPLTHSSTSQFFTSAQRFKDLSMPAPFHEPMTSFNGYMATEPVKADQCIKQGGENRSLKKCKQDSEMDILCCSSKTGEDKSGTSMDLPTAHQLGIIQENIVEQVPVFFKEKYRMEDYDIQNMVFINNFFGKEKVYRGAHYPVFLAGLRIRCHMRFVYIKMSVTSASYNVEEGTVKVYWQLIGLNQFTFLRKLFSIVRNYQAAIDNAEYYCGVSVFHVNKEGKIYKHRVDRMDQIKEGKAVRQPEMAMA
ncbi:uncharacterized protein LOC132548215 [Ylistrum balloti]|uniref:uncharacterized protein LOC132548215 n=1 Tax=Ylistrum balloti TaxID=509963 RepID=UPI0029059ADE|nr:uncharacterized protein LOC132548215 [Ylistrum balloti]